MTVPTCPTPKLKGLRCQQSLEMSAAPQPLSLDQFSRMRFIPLCPMSHLKEWHLGTLLSGLHPHPSQRTWSYMLMCAAILTHVACVHTPCEHARRAQLCPSPRMREVSNEPFPSTGEGAALGDICPTRRHLSNMMRSLSPAPSLSHGDTCPTSGSYKHLRAHETDSDLG